MRRSYHHLTFCATIIFYISCHKKSRGKNKKYFNIKPPTFVSG
nr:MAG TPA: hypothetical protein [Caudoviricetes sp.]